MAMSACGLRVIVMLSCLLVVATAAPLVPAAASAEGWYLMAPPLVTDQSWWQWLKGEKATTTVGKSRPLSEWETVASYDTAAACWRDWQAAIGIAVGPASRSVDVSRLPELPAVKIPKADPGTAAFTKDLDRQFAERERFAAEKLEPEIARRVNEQMLPLGRAIDSQCISTGDPRLKR